MRAPRLTSLTTPGLLASVLLAGGCGGGGVGPGPVPTPTPVTGSPVGVIVFVDDNANGRLDTPEGSRIPQATVRIASRSGVTELGSGHAIVTGVPAGAETVTVDPDSLPPFFVPGPPATVQVPSAADVDFPVVLPIGENNPRTYLAYGDSITLGLGSTDGQGYRAKLEDKLRAYFADARVVNQGRDGENTDQGLRLLPEPLKRVSPAYTLLMLGTNDWNEAVCQSTPPCKAIDNLRSMVRRVKEAHSLPVIATLPPSDPSVNPGRNDWNVAVNAAIKQMAAEEGALVADVYAAFFKQPNVPSLFWNEVHPNDAGYEVIAQAYFDAIAHGHVGR